MLQQERTDNLKDGETEGKERRMDIIRRIRSFGESNAVFLAFWCDFCGS